MLAFFRRSKFSLMITLTIGEIIAVRFTLECIIFSYRNYIFFFNAIQLFLIAAYFYFISLK